MTKKQLVKALEKWPDDAQVELAISVDLHSTTPIMEEKIWLELFMVEETNPDPQDNNMHCLLFGGSITMDNHLR